MEREGKGGGGVEGYVQILNMGQGIMNEFHIKVFECILDIYILYFNIFNIKYKKL